MRLRLSALVALIASAAASSAHAAETTIDLSGEVPTDEYRHFSIEFDVPAGIKEIAIHQESLSDQNVLDFGIMAPDGTWRGWGGSRIKDVVIGEQAATRSHVPGPIAAGKWQIVVGEAAVNVKPANFSLQVTLRDAATMAPQTDRQPYVKPAPLVKEARWYAGDFHVHSIESNDAEPSLEAIATFAKSRGLDFAHISDHNIHTQLDYFVGAQAKFPDFLFLPGAEYTTYWGHASAIGATKWVDDRTELPGHSIAEAVKQYHDQGALFSVNHPTLDVGDLCIGCAWDHDLPADQIDGVEIGTGKFGVFNDTAVEFWDKLSDSGHHIAALSGSDDHTAGEGTGALASPIGNPTTLVFATELSVDGIIEGIRQGKTVVKLESPADPMAELSSNVTPDKDTIRAKTAHLSAKISGGVGYTARWVKNGVEQELIDVAQDPFVIELDIQAPETGEDRWRVEVLEAEKRRTITSNLYITLSGAAGAGGADGGSGSGGSAGNKARDDSDDGGCGCGTRGGAVFGWLGTFALAALLLFTRRRPDRGVPPKS